MGFLNRQMRYVFALSLVVALLNGPAIIEDVSYGAEHRRYFNERKRRHWCSTYIIRRSIFFKDDQGCRSGKWRWAGRGDEARLSSCQTANGSEG